MNSVRTRTVPGPKRSCSSFGPGTDARQPYEYEEGVALDSAGNLYGTSYLGGAYGYGAVYELVAGANGTWTEKVLCSFQGLNDGASPFGSTPSVDAAGNLHGVASAGGAHDYGVVYELIPGSGGSWTEKVYSFTGGGGGASPIGNLLFDASGNLYGTTAFTAYELVHGSNGSWTLKTLHHFAGGKDGATTLAGMVFDKAETSTEEPPPAEHTGEQFTSYPPDRLVLGRRRFCIDSPPTGSTAMALSTLTCQLIRAAIFLA